MNARYRTLLSLVSQTMANTAEKAMEQNKEKGDLEGYKTSMDMRDTHQMLAANIKDENYVPTKEDYAAFCVASLVVVKTLEARVEKEQTSILAYKTDLLPKLQAAMKNPENAENIFTEEKK